MSHAIGAVGDNIEFTAVAIGDYEIFFQHNTNTSSNDEEFKKYPDNQNGLDGSGQTATKFIIRTNKNTDLVEVNGLVFTNPVAIITDKAHVEQRTIPTIFKMKLRTISTNTTIKIRWF